MFTQENHCMIRQMSLTLVKAPGQHLLQVQMKKDKSHLYVQEQFFLVNPNPPLLLLSFLLPFFRGCQDGDLLLVRTLAKTPQLTSAESVMKEKVVARD